MHNATSCYPADVAKRAAIHWVHSVQMQCPTCRGPRLVGFLDGEIVGFACHKCGEDNDKSSAQKAPK